MLSLIERAGGVTTSFDFLLFLTSDESTLEVFKTALCRSMQRQDQAKGISKGMQKDQPNSWEDSDCS